MVRGEWVIVGIPEPKGSARAVPPSTFVGRTKLAIRHRRHGRSRLDQVIRAAVMCASAGIEPATIAIMIRNGGGRREGRVLRRLVALTHSNYRTQ